MYNPVTQNQKKSITGKWKFYCLYLCVSLKIKVELISLSVDSFDWKCTRVSQYQRRLGNLAGSWNLGYTVQGWNLTTRGYSFLLKIVGKFT